MPTVLTTLFWITVLVYAVAFVVFAVSVVFHKPQLLGKALLVTAGGFLLHTAIVTARWAETGHPPFVSYFEAMSASAWFGVLGYIALQQWKPFVRVAGVVVTPLVTLLMGWSATDPFGDDILPVSLQSAWLFVHASFGTASVGCFLFAAGVAVTRLYRQRKNGTLDAAMRTAIPERYDEFNFRLILLGFLLYGMMIVSGSIWAHAAWGRYWGWDPIEVWSLITWLVYAIYLHIYVAVKRLRGTFLAWYTVVALVMAAFSLWGVHLVYATIHTYGD